MKKAREGKEKREVERTERSFIHIWTAGTFHLFRGLNVEGHFCGTRIKGGKPNPATQTEKKLAKDREQKPLSPSGRKNGL